MIIENGMTMCGLINSCVDILIKLYDKKNWTKSTVDPTKGTFGIR